MRLFGLLFQTFRNISKHFNIRLSSYVFHHHQASSSIRRGFNWICHSTYNCYICVLLHVSRNGPTPKKNNDDGNKNNNLHKKKRKKIGGSYSGHIADIDLCIIELKWKLESNFRNYSNIDIDGNACFRR